MCVCKLYSACLLVLLIGLNITSAPFAAESILETIVVSAARESRELGKVATSVSTIDSEDITNVRATHINQLLTSSAGSWISRGNGQEHLTAIRSPVLTGAGACGAFVMAQDGIPLRASGFCNANQLFDSFYEMANSIEVIRGPNSSVFGANAIFGGINILLPEGPGEDSPERANSTFHLDLNQFDYKRLGIESGLDFNENRFWYGVDLSDDGGYRDGSGYKQQKMAIKHFHKVRDIEVSHSLTFSNLNQDTAGFIEGEDAYKDKALIRSNANPDAYRDARSFRGHSRWRWQAGETQLSLKPYFRANNMEFLMHFLPWQPVEKNAHKSLGMQFSSLTQANDSLSYSLGADVDFTGAELSEIQQNPAPFSQAQIPVGTHYDYKVDAISLGVYAGLMYSLFDNTRLEWTTRLDRQQYDYNNLLQEGSACETSVANCRFSRPADGENNFSFNSNKLSALYQISELNSTYITYSNSFRNPQATELFRLQAGQDQTDLDEVEIVGIELGWRGETSRFSYQLAVFDMKLKDDIFQNSERRNVSGANTSHRGVEYEIRYQALNTLSLSVAGTYAEHKYENNPNLLGVNILLAGNDIDTAPRRMNTAKLEWWAKPDLRFELEFVRMGTYFTNPENTASYPGHTLVNLRSQYQLNKQLGLHFNINNLGDTRYAERADIAFGTERYFPGQELTGNFGLELKI